MRMSIIGWIKHVRMACLATKRLQTTLNYQEGVKGQAKSRKIKETCMTRAYKRAGRISLLIKCLCKCKKTRMSSIKHILRSLVWEARICTSLLALHAISLYSSTKT